LTLRSTVSAADLLGVPRSTRVDLSRVRLIASRPLAPRRLNLAAFALHEPQ